MASRRHVQYSPLPSREDDDYNGGSADDPRFAYTPKSFDKIPWKSIFLALFLLVLGCMLLFLSFFILTGHMGGDKSQAYGLLALGILAFLPGMKNTISHWIKLYVNYHFSILIKLYVFHGIFDISFFVVGEHLQTTNLNLLFFLKIHSFYALMLEKEFPYSFEIS